MSDGRYTTLAKVRAEAGLTGNSNIADSIVQIYQDASEDEIDGKLSRRYSLPLAEVPDDLANNAATLGAGLLLLKEYGPEAEGTTKDGKMKVEQVRRWLEEIASGARSLIGSAGAEIAISAGIQARGFPDDEEDDPPIATIDEEF